MRRGSAFLLVSTVLVMVVLLSPSLKAYPGGVGSGDEEYGCSTDCHTVASTATILMTASDYAPDTGGTVTVTVAVEGGQASASALGVQLVSALTDSSSLPSEDGWTIVSDPSGSTTFNYYEMETYASSASFTWTLQAPSTEGTYTLYARVIHGSATGSTAVASDYTGGVSFTVGGTVSPGFLSVVIPSPSEGSTVSDTITVTANIIPAANISWAALRIDGAEVAGGNLTSAPFSWSIDTTRFADGEHTINVTAQNQTGAKGYEQITVTIDNAGEREVFLDWVWTMAAGTVAILAAIGILIVVALLVRRRVMARKGVK